MDITFKLSRNDFDRFESFVRFDYVSLDKGDDYVEFTLRGGGHDASASECIDALERLMLPFTAGDAAEAASVRNPQPPTPHASVAEK